MFFGPKSFNENVTNVSRRVALSIALGGAPSKVEERESENLIHSLDVPCFLMPSYRTRILFYLTTQH
jgi:hypothetical protein